MFNCGYTCAKAYVWRTEDLGVSVHLLPCLRQGLFYFADTNATIAGFQASGDSVVPAFHLRIGTLGLQTHTTVSSLYVASVDLNSGPHICMANT